LETALHIERSRVLDLPSLLGNEERELTSSCGLALATLRATVKARASERMLCSASRSGRSGIGKGFSACVFGHDTPPDRIDVQDGTARGGRRVTCNGLFSRPQGQTLKKAVD
jgi:hypothetical protein